MVATFQGHMIRICNLPGQLQSQRENLGILHDHGIHLAPAAIFLITDGHKIKHGSLFINNFLAYEWEVLSQLWP